MNLFNWMSRAPRFGAALWMLFGLCAPASAGGWVVDRYEYSGSQRAESLHWGQTFTVRDGQVRITDDMGREHVRPGSDARYVLGVGVSRSGGEPIKRKTASSSLDASVTAVLKWNRGTTYNLETGEEEVDPQDNPTTLYVRETATAGASKGISGNNGNAINEMWTPDHPWRGEYYKISGSLGSYDNGHVATGYSSAGVGYGPFNKSKIICIDNPGDEVKIPTYSFHGSVELGEGYEQNEHGDWHSSASINFGYRVDILDFHLGVSAAVSQAQVDGSDLTYDGWVSHGHKINPSDNPADAISRSHFWSGGASYGATARVSGTSDDVFAPQLYEWSGGGLLLPAPENATEYERKLLEIAGSSPVKNLTHNLGDFTADNFISTGDGFPKSTTVKVKVKDGGDGAVDSPMEAKAKINWNVDFQTLYKVSVTFDIHFLDGKHFGPGQVPDSDWDNDGGDDDFKFAALLLKLRRSHNKMIARAAQQTGGALAKTTITVSGFFVLNGTPQLLARGTLTAGEVAAGVTVSRAAAAKASLGPVRVRHIAESIVGFLSATQGLDVNQGNGTRAQNGEAGIRIETTSTATVINAGSIGVQRPTDIVPTKAPPEIIIPAPPLVGPETGPNGNPDGDNEGGTDPPPVNPPVPKPQPPITVPDTEPREKTDTRERKNTYKKWFYTTKPDGFIHHGHDRWEGGTGHNSAWPPGYYFTGLDPKDTSDMTEGELSFKLFGQPYVFGGEEITAVEVEFEQLLRPFPATHQNAASLFRVGDTWNTGLSSLKPKLIRKTRVLLKPGAPGVNDMPAGTLFPVGDGYWTDPNNKANSIWNSTKSGTIDLDERMNGQRRNPVPIHFQNGYPNFWPWNIKDGEGHDITAILPHQQGDQGDSGNDFTRADAELAAKLLVTDLVGQTFYDNNGELVISRVRQWRKNYTINGVKTPLTWHHNQDMKTMQLVPSDNLNTPSLGGVVHDGGGQMARVSRW